MKRKSYISAAVAVIAAAALSFTSCQGGDTQALQAQVDSLTTTVQQQAQDLAFYQECIDLFSEGMDSIARADNSLMTVTTNQEGTVTRESIKEELDTYAGMLARQRERLGALESQLNAANEERGQLKALLDYMNQQIALKDAAIQELQEKVEMKDFSIQRLQDELNGLYAKNAELENRTRTQEKVINIAQDMLNEAYYIVGTGKELKEAGVLTSKFLGKKKVNVDGMDLSIFNPVDIRNFRNLTVEGKITIKSQHPKDSYRVDYDKKTKKSTLVILDEVDFWNLTRYLIIEK